MQRVVVTGLGVVTPVGIGCKNFWGSVLEERCGFADVQSFNTEKYKVRVGCEVKGFNPAEHLQRQAPADMGRTSQMAIAAAREALEDAGLTADSQYESHRSGVCIGTTSGEPLVIEALDDCLVEDRVSESDPDFSYLYPCHVIAAHVAREFQFSGFNQVIPTACAAGNYALAQAMDVLQAGRADMVIAGGADAFSRITYTGFYRLGAISPDVCRPFDKNRQGMVPGEGAAMLVLETQERAKTRGAHIYAEVAGYGLSCDAHHMTGPHPEGDGAARAMQMALKSSKVSPADVDYVCAHGTGTKASDAAESNAISRVFADHAASTPVSSIKSMLGHTMGAASAIEAVACALALQEGRIPPTANWETRDPDCDLDYVTDGAREQELNIVMNNANAFGGNNASVILKKPVE